MTIGLGDGDQTAHLLRNEILRRVEFEVLVSIAQLVEEFEDLARQDCRLPMAIRDGCSALLALRKWEFSEFTRLRRKK